MCGIVGYIGKKYNCIEVLINGLTSLEYRGYDSAGVAYLKDKKIKTLKEKGKLEHLKAKIDFKENANVGIAHTRWATHGEADFKNAHPHTSGKITLVHNGIIENYQVLKEELIKKGYIFISDTDTEVIAVLLDDLYKEENDMLKAINTLTKKLKGSYALAVINSDELDTLYGVKNKSPLILGVEEDNYFLASDIPALLTYTNKYMILDDLDIVVLKDTYTIYNNNKKQEKEKEVLTYEGSIEDVLKNGYDHYMLKEIHEQPEIINKVLSLYLNDEKNNFSSLLPNLSKYNKIHIVGCGSAYHTGLIAKNLFEEYGHVETIVEVASNFTRSFKCRLHYS